VFELAMTALHSDLFPTTFLQKLYYSFDFHPAVLASTARIEYRPLSPVLVRDLPSLTPHNVLVMLRCGATSGGASLLAERT
jgi:hypothetical protein